MALTHRTRAVFSNARLALAFAFPFSMLPSIARAEPDEKPRVVLVTNHADAAIVPLLRAELERMGLAVVEVDHGADDVVPQDLRRAARDTKAVAGFRVLVSKGTVEVWITDRVTGKVALREILPQGSDPNVPEDLVVTRSIELLRASLLELQAPYPPRGEVPAPAAIARLSSYPKPPSRNAVSFGIGFVSSIPGAGEGTALHTVTGAIGIRYAFHPAFSAGFLGQTSLSERKQPVVGGEAHFSTRMFGVDLRHERFWVADWLHGAVGAGMSAFVSKAQGIPSTGYVGEERTSTAPAPYLVASAGVVVTPSLRFDGHVVAAASLHPLAVDSNQTTVARFGIPIVNVGIDAVFLP